MPTVPAIDAPAQALFYQQLQQVTARIHDNDKLEQLMLDASDDICRLFNADRFTLYVVNADRSAIVSKVKTGLTSIRDLTLPISPQSLAGYVAFSRTLLNVPDVEDAAALHRIHPALSFLKSVDRRSGYRTRQMLAAPILDGQVLYGVLQLINRRDESHFGQLDIDGVNRLCQTLATAIRQRLVPAQGAALRMVTQYDGLVADGRLSAEELRQGLHEARVQGVPAEAVLMSLYPLRAAHIGASLARFFGVPYVPASASRKRNEALHGSLKRDFLQTQGWIALEEAAQGLVVMCLDPEVVRGTHIVPQVFPRISHFDYRVTTQFDFNATLEQVYGGAGANVGDMLADLDNAAHDDEGDDAALVSAAADNELVKLVNKIILDAYQQGASDIHIEPMPGKRKTLIRFRVDGAMQPYIEAPAHLRQALVTRLKIMCDLDISEHRRPQDGKIKFSKFGPLDIELRVATIPSAGGVEDVVLRLLRGGEPMDVAQLGLSPHNLARLMQTVERPHGLLYVCGPTGSGKTTTLHSVLKHLNTPERKIWTVEDPVEITQDGLRQVQINRKAGIDYAVVMRAFLRADPDIIMVGESRDRETVATGIEASLTGHLVLSTLHTNSAAESVVRLLDMGMDPFNFADALLGVLAQRLARKLCDCKQAYVPDAAEWRQFALEYAQEGYHAQQRTAVDDAELACLLADWQQTFGTHGALRLYRPIGCDVCQQTGYKGRIGLHEFLMVDDDIRQLIQSRAPVSQIVAAAMAGGMRTLKMDGMEKVLQGQIDLKTARSVCIR